MQTVYFREDDDEYEFEIANEYAWYHLFLDPFSGEAREIGQKPLERGWRTDRHGKISEEEARRSALEATGRGEVQWMELDFEAGDLEEYEYGITGPGGQYQIDVDATTGRIASFKKYGKALDNGEK